MYLSHMCRNRRPGADMGVEFAVKPLFYANIQVLTFREVYSIINIIIMTRRSNDIYIHKRNDV